MPHEVPVEEISRADLAQHILFAPQKREEVIAFRNDLVRRFTRRNYKKDQYYQLYVYLNRIRRVSKDSIAV